MMNYIENILDETDQNTILLDNEKIKELNKNTNTVPAACCLKRLDSRGKTLFHFPTVVYRNFYYSFPNKHDYRLFFYDDIGVLVSKCIKCEKTENPIINWKN